MLKMNRTTFVICLSFLLFSPLMLFAQLAMRLEVNSKNYLTYETIYAKVTLRNQSGHPLVFGNNSKLQGYLTFDVENKLGERVPLINDKYSSLQGRVIPPGKTESVIIPLSKMYNIRNNGKYKVKAVIEHTQLPDSYQSNAVNFKITPGIKVNSFIVGVPTVGRLEDGNKIDKRKYEIRTFFDGVDSVYCLLVEDDKYIYGVARVGYDIGKSKPECEIDRFSKIHILIQSSAEVYTYFIYDTDCHLELKEVYKKERTVPRLVNDIESSRVFVAGGVKAREGTDYFESKKYME